MWSRASCRLSYSPSRRSSLSLCLLKITRFPQFHRLLLPQVVFVAIIQSLLLPAQHAMRPRKASARKHQTRPLSGLTMALSIRTGLVTSVLLEKRPLCIVKLLFLLDTIEVCLPSIPTFIALLKPLSSLQVRHNDPKDSQLSCWNCRPWGWRGALECSVWCRWGATFFFPLVLNS